MGGHGVVAETFRQLMGQALRQASGVDEHQRRAVPGNQVGDPLHDVGHLGGGQDRLQLAVGQFELNVHSTAVPHVDDGRQGSGAHQEPSHQLDGLLGR